MNDSVEALLSLADRTGSEVVDVWGRSSIRASNESFDLEELQGLVARRGLRAKALTTDLDEIELSDAAVTPDRRGELAELARDRKAAREIEAAGSSWTIAVALGDTVEEIEVAIERRNWCRTRMALDDAIETRWVRVLELLTDDPLTVDEDEIRIGLTRRGGLRQPVRIPEGDRPDEMAQPGAAHAWDLARDLADRSAWIDLAATHRRVDDRTLMVQPLALVPTEVSLEPSRAQGGVELWRWRHATDDANRVEALQHVLTVAMTTATRLPDARSLATLGERQRIALSRENAAEVQRAITAGREQTTQSLSGAQDRLRNVAEDTSKATQAAVVASIGVVALSARNADLFPSWLLIGLALAAGASLIVVGFARLRTIDAASRLVDELMTDLAEPLLPEADRSLFQERVDAFNKDERVSRARLGVVGLTALSIAVIGAATGWLVYDDGDSSAGTPAVTTTTTTMP